MVHWDTTQGQVMNSILDMILDDLWLDYQPIDADVFEEALTEAGFMIVPIEDPTNLRFGVLMSDGSIE